MKHKNKTTENLYWILTKGILGGAKRALGYKTTGNEGT